jgi:Flp pilus assembly protein TadG
MAISAIAVFGMVGLAVDGGRMFIAKNEVQTFCDSAALAAALKLNGTTDGIAAALGAVANSDNAWNLDSKRIAATNSADGTPVYQVDFATSSSGPWVPSPNPAGGYVYSRVRATVPLNLYFIPAVVSKGSSDVSARAIAGQSPVTSLTRGLGPFTAVAADPGSPDFGLIRGNEYDIQWPAYNGERAGCGLATPDRCFVRPPCSGESTASKARVVEHWGASTNGFWGANASSTITQEVLDVIQLQPVSIGSMIMMSSGNMATQAVALDMRVNQDVNLIDNNPETYLRNTNNGRRYIGLPIVLPTSAGTQVLGYGAFLLQSDGNPSQYYTRATGNEPFCAVYAGPYTQGGTIGGGAAGYYVVKLME